MTDLTPREIVSELDRFIIGQNDAKRAVSVALRNLIMGVLLAAFASLLIYLQLDNTRQSVREEMEGASIVATHSTDIDPETVVAENERAQVRNRAVVVKRLRPLPIEAVVRGYLAGSGWKEYQQNSAVCGVPLPAGLQNASKLPEPIYTPAAKAAVGDHDENITFEKTVEMIGLDLATQIRDISIQIYKVAAEFALTKGIIIADTKFEFGLDRNGTVVLMDEVLTPDSSRYWPLESYVVGQNPPSYDKQFLRDWLETAQVGGKPWDKTPPAPRLPREVIEKTAAKYQEALTRLMG